MIVDCGKAEKIPVTLHIDLRDLTVLANALHFTNAELAEPTAPSGMCSGCQERSFQLEDIVLEKIKRIEREQNGRN